MSRSGLLKEFGAENKGKSCVFFIYCKKLVVKTRNFICLLKEFGAENKGKSCGFFDFTVKNTS